MEVEENNTCVGMRGGDVDKCPPRAVYLMYNDIVPYCLSVLFLEQFRKIPLVSRHSTE